MTYVNTEEKTLTKMVSILERIEERISAIEYALLDLEELPEKELKELEKIETEMKKGKYYSVKDLKRVWNV
ncbi:hypothetical protein J7J26_03150 [Candidatus Micrarchaeota archaeon]|nr:hypothetical protein [Candidatus Micrarchaeota archaeon]